VLPPKPSGILLIGLPPPARKLPELLPDVSPITRPDELSAWAWLNEPTCEGPRSTIGVPSFFHKNAWLLLVGVHALPVTWSASFNPAATATYVVQPSNEPSGVM